MYNKDLEYETAHSCQQVTDEPCDACICEEEEREEQLSHIDSTEKRNNILKRLKKIEEQTKELYNENADLHDKILANDIKLADFAQEKKEIIMKLL
jgi:hypothetical protein